MAGILRNRLQQILRQFAAHGPVAQTELGFVRTASFIHAEVFGMGAEIPVRRYQLLKSVYAPIGRHAPVRRLGEQILRVQQIVCGPVVMYQGIVVEVETLADNGFLAVRKGRQCVMLPFGDLGERRGVPAHAQFAFQKAEDAVHASALTASVYIKAVANGLVGKRLVGALGLRRTGLRRPSYIDAFFDRIGDNGHEGSADLPDDRLEFFGRRPFRNGRLAPDNDGIAGFSVQKKILRGRDELTQGQHQQHHMSFEGNSRFHRIQPMFDYRDSETASARALMYPSPYSVSGSM